MFAAPRRLRARHEGLLPDARPGPNDRGLSRKHILAAIDASLRRLGTDYVDLYQIHRWDPETPIEETMEALHDVVRAGKARYIGASSMFAWQFAKASTRRDAHGWTRFVSMQNHYNLVYREEEREMIPLLPGPGRRRDAVEPAGPRRARRQPEPRRRAAHHARGHRRVRRQPATATDDFAVVDASREVAAERGVPPAQVALAWLLAQPGVTAPIVGATKLRHLDDAVAALDLDLTEAQRARLERDPPAPR